MEDKRPVPCVFRPKGKSQELIERAAKLGVNVSSVLNDILDKHGATFFEPAIKERKKELRELLEA